jgi:hypothetical protein
VKNFLNILFAFTIVLSAKAQCPNGNAEQGNFSSWNTQSGDYSTPINKMTPNSPPSRVSIISIPYSDGTIPPMVTNNTDNYGNFPIPNEGKYAFRLGNNSPSGKSDAMWYKFTVTAVNAHFKFRYSMVLNDIGHPSDEQPYFSWFMNVVTKSGQGPHLPPPRRGPFGGYFDSKEKKLDRNLFQTTNKQIVADGANPFFQTSKIDVRDGNALTKIWQCVEYDLSSYIGYEVLIYFRSADCKPGGHFGYAYIDGLCDAYPATASFVLNKTQLCDDGKPLMMDGSSSTGEDRYFIEIAESNNATGTSLNPSNKISGYTYGKEASLIDLNQWYKNQGGVWKCNKYYKVKLSVSNDCAAWNEKNQMIYYYCPPTNAGPDLQKCCIVDKAYTIGTAAVAGNKYNWTSIPAGFTSNIAQPLVNPSTSTTYKVSIIDENGCKATDDMDFYILHPIKLSLQYTSLPGLDCSSNTKPANCAGLISTNATPWDCIGRDGPAVATPEWLQKEKNKYTYLWNTGEKTPTIIPRAGITTYSVTVTNGCYSATASITVRASDYFSQPIQSIGANNGIIPNSSTAAQRLCTFFEYGSSAPSLGVGPAYHAYRYRLRIFNRNGENIRFISDCNPNGFVNGSIKWDGRDGYGNLVQGGVYVAQLTLWNCNTPEDGNMDFSILTASKKIGSHPFSGE